MKVLVANLGSTSFKYRLFDLPSETQLARGGIDRIGQATSACCVEINGRKEESSQQVSDHAAAVQICLDQITHPEYGCLKSVSEVAAIGFKAVFAGNMSGVRVVTDELLTKMEDLSDIAPAHNPMYAKAMRQLRSAFPQIPLVAALETAFHDTIPPENKLYSIPLEWSEQYEIKRWGFHGASHRYLNTRMAQLLGRSDLKVITCHLGGSNSLCAARAGQSQATSMGMSPQTGLLHNNRVGDFDPFAIPVIMQATGKSLDEVLHELAEKSGLLGLSGVSGDIRDLEEAAATGHARARLALDVFAAEIRRHLGGVLAELGGADVIVFTGGIGENAQHVRTAVLGNLKKLGIVLDPSANDTAKGECSIHAPESRTQIWIVPTNEELIVARQAKELLAPRP